MKCDWCRTQINDKLAPRKYEGVEVYVCSLCWKHREKEKKNER